MKTIMLSLALCCCASAVIPDDAPSLPPQFTIAGKTSTCQITTLDTILTVAVQCSNGARSTVNSPVSIFGTEDILLMIYRRADGKTAFESSVAGAAAKSGFLQPNAAPVPVKQVYVYLWDAIAKKWVGYNLQLQ